MLSRGRPPGGYHQRGPRSLAGRQEYQRERPQHHHEAPEVNGAHRLDVEEDLMNQPSTDSTQTGSILAAPARAAIFTALRPALEALFVDAGNDAQLSAEARRILRALVRTRPENTLALADLAARGSTSKARVPAALHELETHGYLQRLTHIAPHLTTALPAPAPAEPRA